MRCAARAAMDASRASEASDDDDRRDGDADDGVDAAGDVSGVGWSAASGVASQALRGGAVVGPSSGQAAVGPAGHACARMAAHWQRGCPQTVKDAVLGASTAAHSPLGNGRARQRRVARQHRVAHPVRRRAPSLQAAALRMTVLWDSSRGPVSAREETCRTASKFGFELHS